MEVGIGTRGVLHMGRLAELYEAHADGARKLAYLLTGDRTLAEDLVQDAFVKLAGRLAHIRDPQAFEAYLRRTVLNLSRMHFRRKKVERMHLQREMPRTTDRLDPPDGAARETLRRGLLTLPERQRAALVLRFYLDVPDEQAAELLGCRPGTVRSLISRGLDGLRRKVGDPR
jgi:RNA polymerase sigma-70 factor (sigma-E family)